MVVVRAVEIRTHAHTLHPHLTVDDGTVGIHQTGFSLTDALDLRTRKDYTCRVGLNKELLKRILLVAYLYRTLLPELFLCLIHLNDLRFTYLRFTIG